MAGAWAHSKGGDKNGRFISTTAAQGGYVSIHLGCHRVNCRSYLAA